MWLGTLSVMTLYLYLRLRTPSQSRLTPCQLSQRESQGAGVARPAHRNFCAGNSAAQPLLAPPMGELASEARLRGRRQWQVWKNAVIVTGYPLSHNYHPPSNRVTPNGVGQLPGSQARHSQRVQPALSVTAFSRASSPKGRAKGRALPAQRTEIFAPAIRRRSRPWLPLWGSWRAKRD